MSDQLYREEFMEIYKSGLNYGQISDPTLVGDKVNSACGDKLTLQIKLEGDKVSDAKFFGVACAVSKTSASILTEFIKGKTVNELRKLTEPQILELIKFDLTASRQQCALLCYHALQEALRTMPKIKSKKEVAKKDLEEVAKDKKITKDHNLGELVFAYPKVAEVLLDYGLHCVGCGAMHFDTIEAGAKLHGFTDEEVDELVVRINEVIEFGE